MVKFVEVWVSNELTPDELLTKTLWVSMISASKIGTWLLPSSKDSCEDSVRVNHKSLIKAILFLKLLLLLLLLLIIIPLIPQLQRSYLHVFQCFSLPLSLTQTFLKPFSNQFQSPKTVLPWLLLLRMSTWFFFWRTHNTFSSFLLLVFLCPTGCFGLSHQHGYPSGRMQPGDTSR